MLDNRHYYYDTIELGFVGCLHIWAFFRICVFKGNSNLKDFFAFSRSAKAGILGPSIALPKMVTEGAFFKFHKDRWPLWCWWCYWSNVQWRTLLRQNIISWKGECDISWGLWEINVEILPHIRDIESLRHWKSVQHPRDFAVSSQ